MVNNSLNFGCLDNRTTGLRRSHIVIITNDQRPPLTPALELLMLFPVCEKARRVQSAMNFPAGKQNGRTVYTRQRHNRNPAVPPCGTPFPRTLTHCLLPAAKTHRSPNLFIVLILSKNTKFFGHFHNFDQRPSKPSAISIFPLPPPKNPAISNFATIFFNHCVLRVVP